MTTRECPNPTYKTVFCATDKTGQVCSGDSGGPIVADRDGDGRWVLYGVVSFGNPCGSSNPTEAFADVSLYADEILSRITYY